MKKFLKVFFIIILVLVVLYLVHSLITAKVYFDIYTAMKEKVEAEDTFYAKNYIKTDDKYSMEFEVFIKDNTFVKKLTRINENNERDVELKFWQKYLPNKSENEDGRGYIFATSNEDKSASILEYDPTAKEPENKMYRYYLTSSLILGQGLNVSFFSHLEMKDYTYFDMFLETLTKPSILYTTTYNDKECYAIKQFAIFDMGVFLFEGDANYLEMLTSTYIQYIDKDTKLPIGAYSENLLVNQGEVEYFTREVTDEDIKLPDLKEYKILEN